MPVSDVDRAKGFYAERLGFSVDTDAQLSDEFRVVQLTPFELDGAARDSELSA